MQLVGEDERIIGHEIRPRQRFAHPAKNREVEEVAIMRNADVAATKLAECRTDFLEEGRRRERLVVELVLLECLIRNGDSRPDERLEPLGDFPVADTHGCNLHNFCAQRVAVSGLEIDSCEIPKMICEGAAAHVLHRLEHSQGDTKRGAFGKLDDQRSLRANAAEDHVPNAGAGENSLERDLDAVEARNPEGASSG